MQAGHDPVLQMEVPPRREKDVLVKVGVELTVHVHTCVSILPLNSRCGRGGCGGGEEVRVWVWVGMGKRCGRGWGGDEVWEGVGVGL